MKKIIIISVSVLLIFIIISSYLLYQNNSLSKNNSGASFKYTLKLLSKGYTFSEHKKFISSKITDKHEKIKLKIPKKGIREIAIFLKENKLISNVNYFLYLLRLKSFDKKIKTGEFEFYKDMTPIQIAKILIEGKEVQYEITLPENITYKEMAQRLEEAEITKANEFIKLCESKEILKKYNVKTKIRKNYIPTMEGYLYPETYKFKKWTPAKEVLDRLVRANTEALDKLKTLIEKSKFTKHEIVTLASIIGKETTTDSERFKVSSVFHNRLNKNILLQTDPTLIYMVTDRKSTKYHAAITKKHLKDKSNPYNTYIYKGIPPGPIGNPNYKSLEAVLKPQKTNYLFFVSNNDGTHTFTTNLKDHEKAVKIYWNKVRKSKKKN